MISIVKTPKTFTPVKENYIVFQIATDNPDIIYFLVQVVENGTGCKIINQMHYIRPEDPTGVSFNLFDVLKSYKASILNYRLIITEKLNHSGSIVNGDVYNNESDTFTFNPST